MSRRAWSSHNIHTVGRSVVGQFGYYNQIYSFWSWFQLLLTWASPLTFLFLTLFICKMEGGEKIYCKSFCYFMLCLYLYSIFVNKCLTTFCVFRSHPWIPCVRFHRFPLLRQWLRHARSHWWQLIMFCHNEISCLLK